MIICPKCGKRNSDRAANCFHCGSNLQGALTDRATQHMLKEKATVSRMSTEAGKADLTEKIKINDLYEYDVVTITDKSTGAMDVVSLRNVLSE